MQTSSPGWSTISTSLERPLIARIKLSAERQGIKISRWLEGAALERLLKEGSLTIEEINARPIGKIRRFMEVIE